MTIKVLTLAAFLSINSCNKESVEPVQLGLMPDKVFNNHIEVEVGFESHGDVLYGKLFLPKSNGPHPIMIHHFGSDKWTTLQYSSSIQAPLDEGLGMFFYDKRGVGRSQGNCCPYQDTNYFPLLADDIKSAITVIKKHPQVDSTKIGLYGFSQGGWVLPIVAADTNVQVKWMVIGSGPTVSLGEEIYYSEISGDDKCEQVNKTEDELLEIMDKRGPSGFDPKSFLEKISCPSIWVYGGLDRNIPVKRSISILDTLKAKYNKDFTIILKPSWNHCWVENGGICDCSGTRGDQYFIFEWIKKQAGL